jgi:glycine cleavage system H protein
MYPEDYSYTKDHEWVKVEGANAVIGITDYAQHELGDVVYVDMPAVGDSFEANEPFGSVESVKAVSEIFCPLTGEVVEVNAKLIDAPELINKSPQEQAWMIKLRMIKPDEIHELMTADEYEEYIQEQAAGH